MFWKEDEIFDYPVNTLTKLEVFWNLDDDEIEIIKVKVDEDSTMSGEDLWDFDYELAEDIMSYIDNEFLESEDFWMSKMGYDF